ncbi:PREDICTED: spermatogenesis-associated protein 5 [Rhagoletis zephyria]|uniref:spermatogenesis-associated protein 5 n=1 Tax=Rhagoletis zephyria TaxID=28612 RepID=UPI0008114DD0|nr:PREDICTED: spermatogenesis-associated protein 5 [Rhagoletis zephyria]
MPPKSSNKKSGGSVASWYHCELCDVHITSKDRETHEKYCPIPADTAEPLEYIHNNCLYTTGVEKRSFHIEELNDVPNKYINNLVFISEGAIRLTHLYIGQRVLIQPVKKSEAVGLVRLVWPIPDRFLTTIFVSEEDFKMYGSDLGGQSLKISALLQPCSVAKSVGLRVTSIVGEITELMDAQLKDVERLLKLELKNLIFTTGSRIFMDFFNKDLTLQVVSWSSFGVATSNTEDDANLEETFKSLKLECDVEPRFFEVTCATRFEIERHKTESTQENSTNYNKVTKIDVGGLDEQIEMIEEAIDMAFGLNGVPAGVKVSRGFLLHGPTGCGKSLLSQVMCSTMLEKTAKLTKVELIRINTSELFSKFLGETEKNLMSHFEKAFENYPTPTLIVIEDVHNLCPKYETNEMTKRVGAAFLSALDILNGPKKEAQRTFLLATTSQIDALNPNVRRCGRLDSEIEISAPTPKQRAAILSCLLRSITHKLSPADIDDVAQVLHGYVGADLANLVYAASLRALKDDARPLHLPDLHAALTHIKPSAMREVLIENPNVHWSDIGGQAELKLKLKQAIEWPLLHPDKFERLGLKPPRGILMFGPPGCSKTMIAKALATESQLNFLSIKGPELFSMWVGESERAVREVFRKARQVAPAIVFFDEIDAIGGERADGGDGGSGTSVKERVLTQLLTEMDGVEALENVTIVAATNRPDMIDKALLRPGRFDRIVYVGLPDTEARQEIFRIKLVPMPLAADVDLQKLVQRTEGYSGAEIQAVCQEAALKCLEESFEAERVRWTHFEYALNAVQPRTNPELLQLYDQYIKQK